MHLVWYYFHTRLLQLYYDKFYRESINGLSCKARTLLLQRRCGGPYVTC